MIYLSALVFCNCICNSVHLIGARKFRVVFLQPNLYPVERSSPLM